MKSKHFITHFIYKFKSKPKHTTLFFPLGTMMQSIGSSSDEIQFIWIHSQYALFTEVLCLLFTFNMFVVI